MSIHPTIPSFELKIDDEFDYEHRNGHARVFRDGDLVENGRFVGSTLLCAAAHEIQILRKKARGLDELLHSNDVFLEPAAQNAAAPLTVEVDQRRYAIHLLAGRAAGSTIVQITRYYDDEAFDEVPQPEFFAAVARALHDARRRVAELISHLIEHGIAFELDLAQ